MARYSGTCPAERTVGKQFSERLDELSGYRSQIIPIPIYGSASDSCTASTGNCLCVAGIMESKNVPVGKQRGKRNCPYR